MRVVTSEHDQKLLLLARDLLALSEAEADLRGHFADEEERRQAIFAEFTRRIADHPEGPSLKAALRRLSDH